MASNIDIMSRGVTPRELSAAATFSTVGNSGRAIMAPLSSLILTSVLLTTCVEPVWPKALGWETSGAEAMLMVTLPCEMAQLEMWMRAVATMVPVRSLMMTRAGTSGVNSNISICEIKSTDELVHPGGMHTRTVV